MKSVIAFIIPLIVLVHVSSISIDSNNQRYSQAVNSKEDHDCCLWAAISTGLPDNYLYNNLVLYPSSLKALSYWGNVDGWGIASYPDFGAMPILVRSALRAFEDVVFDHTVLSLDTSASRIILAHIRHCTSGCCCHYCNTIDDPHPFWRVKNGRTWTFGHNGRISKAILSDLIGEEYLSHNPPNGSGVPECDPSDSSHVTDSELFFLLLLKGIEQANWQVTEGITNALVELIERDNGSRLNFILSDSHELWAFRKAHDLSVLYDSLGGYSAAATYPPDAPNENWQVVQDYVLTHMQPGTRPQNINLRAYLPPVVNCPGDTSLIYVLARPVCIDGFTISDPDDNLDAVLVNQGTYDKGRVCFYPSPGINTIIVTARDHYGNSASCSTIVDATLSNPGYLTGMVIDDSTMMPLDNVLVSLGEITDSTGGDGHYLIPDLVPSIYSVNFALPGYTDTTVLNVTVLANDTTIIDVILQAGCRYIPGDANGDCHFNGLDVGYSVSFLKGAGPRPPFQCNCPTWGRFYSAADANGSCSFNGLDVTYSVSYLKGLGPAPRGCDACPPER